MDEVVMGQEKFKDSYMYKSQICTFKNSSGLEQRYCCEHTSSQRDVTERNVGATPRTAPP
jgi:hypothetical protein